MHLRLANPDDRDRLADWMDGMHDRDGSADRALNPDDSLASWTLNRVVIAKKHASPQGRSLVEIRPDRRPILDPPDTSCIVQLLVQECKC